MKSRPALTKLFLLSGLFSLFPLVTAAQPSPHDYHFLSTFSLEGEGGWDFLTFDDIGRRLFISHATHVLVYDVDNRKIVGDISNTEGVHGIAIAGEFGRGFISNGKSNTVLVFDLKTLDTLKRIVVGDKPDAITYDPYSKLVIVCNANSNDLTLIEPSTGTVKTTVALSGNPESAVSDRNGSLFVNIENKNEVAVVDMKKSKVLHYWGLGDGEGPTGIAMDLRTHRLFIGCANERMVIVNSDNGKIVAKLPIGKGVDAVIFDAERNTAISSNGEGSLTIVKETNANKFEVTETVKTQPGARTEVLDPKTHDIYLVTSDFGPPPEPTTEHPHPHPSIIPNTFRLLKFGY